MSLISLLRGDAHIQRPSAVGKGNILVELVGCCVFSWSVVSFTTKDYNLSSIQQIEFIVTETYLSNTWLVLCPFFEDLESFNSTLCRIPILFLRQERI